MMKSDVEGLKGGDDMSGTNVRPGLAATLGAVKRFRARTAAHLQWSKTARGSPGSVAQPHSGRTLAAGARASVERRQ
jgi:hypothetical protein